MKAVPDEYPIRTEIKGSFEEVDALMKLLDEAALEKAKCAVQGFTTPLKPRAKVSVFPIGVGVYFFFTLDMCAFLRLPSHP